MNVAKYLIFAICLTFVFDFECKSKNPPGYLVNAAVIKGRRILNGKREAKATEDPYNYYVGKIGQDKTMTFNSEESEVKKIQTKSEVVVDSLRKKALFSCALDEVESYPLLTFSDEFYLIITDFYAPFENDVPSNNVKSAASKKEFKLEIRIIGSDDKPKLSVKAFSKGKKGKPVDEKTFANIILKNIQNRYKSKYPEFN